MTHREHYVLRAIAIAVLVIEAAWPRGAGVTAPSGQALATHVAAPAGADTRTPAPSVPR